ncbi:MAG: site-2 protease family protein [Candidatus Lokiarchaeota archaeon]|nr:site-2 protease family protein [Candidatus Lokiarchaeota archaeon]
MEAILAIIFNPWTIVSLIFWLFVGFGALVLRKRKGAAYVFFPLLAMFKTKRLNKFINSIGQKSPRLWRMFWTMGIFVSFSFMIFAFWFFFSNLVSLIIEPQITNVITPLIPGVTISLPTFMYLILPLLFVITTHELAHGISSSVDGVEVVSSGVLGAGIFFLIGLGAFVEVDERKVRSSKYPRNTRLRIATSGTFINAITAFIGLLILMALPFLIQPFYRQAPQIAYMLTEEEGGFNYGVLGSGDVIVGVKKDNGSYVYLDYQFDLTLTRILDNKTKIACSPGNQLTFLTFNPGTNKEQERIVTLGPHYYYGFSFEKYNDTAIEITEVDTQEDGGNNWWLEVGNLITEINGNPLNYTIGDTFEKHLTVYGLTSLNITMSDSTVQSINIAVNGVYIGVVYDSLYWMGTNEVSQFFGPFWPDFTIKEFSWLFIISFSLVLFNTLPLPIFDGDRVTTELVNWGLGEGSYTKKKKKKEKFTYKKSDKNYEFMEYRVDKIISIKTYQTQNGKNLEERNEHLLNPNACKLVDTIGDGHYDAVQLEITPTEAYLEEDKSIIEVEYEYWFDEKSKKKKYIINFIRLITLVIVLGNFILSFVKFGFGLFWVPI